MSYNVDDSIVNILIEDLNDFLNIKLIDDVSDDTKAGLVRPGKLQADPTDFETNIMIHEGGDDFPDELKTDNDTVFSPTYEVGGTDWWWRRFVIECILFYDNENERSIARQKANILNGRVRRALKDYPINTTMDAFGEQAHYMQVISSSMNEGGGEGTFIWRGRIFLEFLTSAR